jgi:hypothetical protein
MEDSIEYDVFVKLDLTASSGTKRFIQLKPSRTQEGSPHYLLPQGLPVNIYDCLNLDTTLFNEATVKAYEADPLQFVQTVKLGRDCLSSLERYRE